MCSLVIKKAVLISKPSVTHTFYVRTNKILDSFEQVLRANHLNFASACIYALCSTTATIICACLLWGLQSIITISISNPFVVQHALNPPCMEGGCKH